MVLLISLHQEDTIYLNTIINKLDKDYSPNILEVEEDP